MPGSVANAAPTTVLPAAVFSAFSESRQYNVLQNSYRNGESQRSVWYAATNSQKVFTQDRRLTPAEMTALRAFYLARKGGTEPFYVYHPWETVPIYSHDPTGVATAGRYTMRFDGDWSGEMGLPRGNAGIVLIETA